MANDNDSAGRAVIPGSSVDGPADAAGSDDAAATAQVSVILRRRNPLPEGEQVDPATFDETYGADPADIAAVSRAVEEAGLHVVGADAGTRTVKVAGTVRALSAFFGASMGTVTHDDGKTYRARTGDLSVPADLDGMITAVLGLDERPAAETRSSS